MGSLASRPSVPSPQPLIIQQAPTPITTAVSTAPSEEDVAIADLKNGDSRQGD